MLKSLETPQPADPTLQIQKTADHLREAALKAGANPSQALEAAMAELHRLSKMISRTVKMRLL